MQHEDPAQAQESEIVGRPTLLAKFPGMMDANQVLASLGAVGYPLEDVSVLFRPDGGTEVVDLTTGHVAAGQSITDEELDHRKLDKGGQTVVLLHPTDEQLPAVRQALLQVGNPEIEYAGETHAFGRLGGVERQDEQVT